MTARPYLTPSLPKQRESGRGGDAGRLTESMLTLLVNSLGFTPGLRPAPSARSFIESPVAMRVDLEGVSPEMVEVAEALESVVSELQDINTIQKQNIQKLVSCPDPAPPSAHATRPLCAVSPQLSLNSHRNRALAGPDFHALQGQHRGHQRANQVHGAVAA